MKSYNFKSSFNWYFWCFRPYLKFQTHVFTLDPKINSWHQIYLNTLTVKLLGPLVVMHVTHSKTLNCDISCLESDTEMVDHSIDPLLFLVIPKSPKTCSRNIAIFNLYQTKFHFHFCFYHPWLSFLAQG